MANPRSYTRFSQAADEVGRIQGSHIAHWTFQKFLRPVPGTK